MPYLKEAETLAVCSRQAQTTLPSLVNPSEVLIDNNGSKAGTE
jgi:hypothetical protein